MSFNDAYKSMLLNRGGSVNSSDIRNSKNSINRQFKNDPSYKLATLRVKDTSIEDSELDTRIINVDTNTKKKKIYVRPDTKFEVGDYIIYPDRTYLVLEVEDNLISPYASVEECNYILKWMVNGTCHEAWGIGTDQTKYTLGVSAQSSAGILEADARYSILFPNDSNCKSVGVGTRFLFNDGAWKVTKIEYVSTQDNLRSLLLAQDSINYEIDDVQEEIADRWLINHTYTYDVPTNFEVANGSEYVLNYSIKDETGKDFDYSLITVTTVDNTLVQITNINDTISIKGLSVGIGSVNLSVPIGSTSEEFIINFEVKDVVVDKTEYTTNFSQTTTIKQYVTSILTTSKYINGVKDDTLQIDYSFDSVGQNLISTGKIIVTTKSDSSIAIKNALITTSTTIYLTVIDTSDNTKILDNEPITLVKGL